MVIYMDSSFNYKIISHDLYKGFDMLEKFITKIEEKLLAIQEDLSILAEIILILKDLKLYNEVIKC